MGPRNEWRIILCGLACAYTEDIPTPCSSLNLIQHNTSNNVFEQFG
jgi:hypothetical protein